MKTMSNRFEGTLQDLRLVLRHVSVVCDSQLWSFDLGHGSHSSMRTTGWGAGRTLCESPINFRACCVKMWVQCLIRDSPRRTALGTTRSISGLVFESNSVARSFLLDDVAVFHDEDEVSVG